MLNPLQKNTKRYQEGQQNLQTGNRIYKGTSNSPHSGGGLDKTGYQTRDNKVKQKRDVLLKQLRSGGF